MVSRPLPLDADPAEIASSLRLQNGPHSAWILASHQVDLAAEAGDKKALIFWRRVVRSLDELEG